MAIMKEQSPELFETPKEKKPLVFKKKSPKEPEPEPELLPPSLPPSEPSPESQKTRVRKQFPPPSPPKGYTPDPKRSEVYGDAGGMDDRRRRDMELFRMFHSNRSNNGEKSPGEETELVREEILVYQPNRVADDLLTQCLHFLTQRP